ncbi:hypothetical protein BBO99_00007128 [Phytophthora kernoviae]|uniref:Tyrosine specific protein phosphatases domain-containing protein n=1 Tax=Phytophthora kernoviae TaxID=325452 RepID=A0A421FH76_9STRA|nr:hypothetical protein JM16_006584 [Phytophthora kernoviae]RLN44794.1 hypothetical protein BBI17_007035 [Phytophthora kernoviae]RLN76964.1 hypothetical protein BBO99_00007128 [Phytophthora kernoviae]
MVPTAERTANPAELQFSSFLTQLKAPPSTEDPMRPEQWSSPTSITNPTDATSNTSHPLPSFALEQQSSQYYPSVSSGNNLPPRQPVTGLSTPTGYYTQHHPREPVTTSTAQWSGAPIFSSGASMVPTDFQHQQQLPQHPAMHPLVLQHSEAMPRPNDEDLAMDAQMLREVLQEGHTPMPVPTQHRGQQVPGLQLLFAAPMHPGDMNAPGSQAPGFFSSSLGAANAPADMLLTMSQTPSPMGSVPVAPIYSSVQAQDPTQARTLSGAMALPAGIGGTYDPAALAAAAAAGGMLPPATLPRKKRTTATRICKVEGCTKGIRSRGLCKAHGGGRRCTTPGCTTSDQGGGHCVLHGGGRRCRIEGCKKSAQWRGVCKMHGGARRCRSKSLDHSGGEMSASDRSSTCFAASDASEHMTPAIETEKSRGTSAGFRKFREALMAKKFESQDNVPFTYLRLAVADVSSAHITDAFDEALHFIDSTLIEGGKVLVHCFMGRSRSATIVLAHLIARQKLTLSDKIPLRNQEASETCQFAESDAKISKAPIPASAPAKILFLDGVRGLAAILVVSQHSREYLHDLDLGACAVDAFFVLSSFLLTMIFMKKSIRMLAQKASYRKWIFSLADYFSKRFFRVYPLFAVVVVLLWMLPFEDKQRYFLVKERSQFDLFKVLTFDFHHRYFVFWTLPLEISYYFCLPVFVLGVLNLRRFWWVPLIPLYGWVIHAGWHERRSSHSPLRPHFPTFIAGSMAAILFVKLDTWIKTTGFEFKNWQKLAVRVVEYAAIALTLSVCFRRNSSHGNPVEPTMLFHWVHKPEGLDEGGFPFISVPVTMIIVIEMLLPSCVAEMFEWSVFRYWGKISFSVYLLHSFVLFSDIFDQEPNLYYERMFWRFGLILLLATASYHLVEYPSQLLSQRITKALAEQEAKGLGSATLPFVFDTKRLCCAQRATQIA